MLLTRLEIKGFKSFGDKVVINFDEGITGIVGPNGCGKSNVVDAIRWVLGEQKTRALRSEKMENVIFNGTSTRKATQLAEVGMSFKNTKNLLPTEYSEVTITRRYFRSGESEYLLNGVTCRLKDINNLFMDTGIGPDSYAIIELKMIDDILNDKDNSRRNLFEEAAGISKFKIRKKQSLKKLEDTDADLERVEDLLHEITRNMKSLEKQARQAEKYNEYKTDLRKLSTALAFAALKELDVKLETLRKTTTEENDKVLQINTQLATLDSEIEKKKNKVVESEKLLASRQKTLNEHINKIRSFESEKKIKNERLSFLEDRESNLKNQLEQEKKSHERASFSLSKLREEKETADKDYETQDIKVNNLRVAHEAQKNSTKAIK